MLSCWEPGQPASALQAFGQHHRVRMQDWQAWSAKRPFPSRIFLSSLAVLWTSESIILPPGQSLASSPDGCEQGGSMEIRKRAVTDSWPHIRWQSPIHPPPSPPPSVICQELPGWGWGGGCHPLFLCSSEVIRCLLVTWHDAGGVL